MVSLDQIAALKKGRIDVDFGRSRCRAAEICRSRGVPVSPGDCLTSCNQTQGGPAMTSNTHPEPQPLSRDTDDQSTVAAPDDSSLTGTEPDEVIGNLDARSTGGVEGGDSDMPQSPDQGGKTGNAPGSGTDLPDGAAGGAGAGASGAGTEEDVQQPLDDDPKQT
jgi:hypothetical protein